METIYEDLDNGFIDYLNKEEAKANLSLDVFQYKLVGDYNDKTNKTTAEISYSPDGKIWYEKVKSDYGL